MMPPHMKSGVLLTVLVISAVIVLVSGAGVGHRLSASTASSSRTFQIVNNELDMFGK